VQRVVQTFKRQSARTLKPHFDSGESIETTEEHPFFVEKKGFVPATWLAIPRKH
jgi:intein/homing endonuclease